MTFKVNWLALVGQLYDCFRSSEIILKKWMNIFPWIYKMVKWPQRNKCDKILWTHYSDVIMGAMASQITSLAIVCSTVYLGSNQRKHQSSASLAFVWGIHPWRGTCCHMMTSSCEYGMHGVGPEMGIHEICCIYRTGSGSVKFADEEYASGNSVISNGGDV